MFRSNFNFRRHFSDENQPPQANRENRPPRDDSRESLQRYTENEDDSDRKLSGVQAPLGTQNFRRDSSASSTDTRGRSPQPHGRYDTDSGPLGLNVVYTPGGGKAEADIIFVHGLGGTSRFTWSKYRNPDLFWPLEFLPLEPDINRARILSFGYNANFARRGGVSVSMSDFARDLLFDLKYAKDEEKRDLEIGNVPLIFVVHSMGGLIIKEAYIQGQNDPEYESIIKAISAITFLATPHRGTNLAMLLNRILTSTFFSNSKQYLSDLTQNSIALQKLNDQFRHIAPKLDIVSFYETQPTPIGLKSAAVMILEKDTSVLGYPGETSKGLDADHHNMCKYESPHDPNYIIVRNVLTSLLSKILANSHSFDKPQMSDQLQSRDIKSLLGVTDLPDVDYIFFRDQWAEETSNWILHDKIYLKWFDSLGKSETTRVLWLNGGPGTGKSVISSFIINEVVKQGFCCQYFFIRSGNDKRRNLSLLLRSIAYQLTRSVPEFLKKALVMIDEGIDFGTVDARTVWERLFKSVLFQLQKPPQALYWIIDGIDEADDPRAVVKQFSDSSLSAMNIRILLVSRKTSEITAAFNKFPTALNLDSVSIEGHLEDIRYYVLQELNMMALGEYKDRVVERIMDESQNSFLWVRLVVQSLNSCYTQADVDAALLQLPIGMEALYDRMASAIAQYKSPRDRALATAILECVTSSLRVLTVAELSQALSQDASGILDVQRSILDLCAGFAVVDNGGNVAMVHQTARKYLLDGEADRPFYVQKNTAHAHMFSSCMQSLMATGLKAKLQRHQKPEFLDYAATYWSKHLVAVPHNYNPANEALSKFLNGPWVLIWIYYLSSTNQLGVLVQAARHLSARFIRQKQYQPTLPGEDGTQLFKRTLLEGWATDLIKIAGKFGAILRRNPDAIYKLIPPFCPQSSSIYQTFGKLEARTLSVSGISFSNWDDSTTRISPGLGIFTASITTAGGCIAILASSGTVMRVFLFDSSDFEALPASPITHGERVQMMELNSTGTILATYGYRKTKVWDVASGECKLSVDNFETGQRPLTMLLMSNTNKLLVGTDDCCLRLLDMADESPSWQPVAELEEEEIEGHYLNSASFMALNGDGSLIAVAHRGHPLSAWEVDGPNLLGQCWRTREEVAFGQVIDASWNPHYPEVFGLYYDGVLFRWKPYDDEREEITVGASKLSISRDGNLIATGDARGMVKIFATADLVLIYQLAAEDTVFGVTFSPDIRRIYDIRGYHCNVWEPNALVRFAEQRGNEGDDGSDNDGRALSLMHSDIPRSGRIDSVTVLAASPLGKLYSYGTDKGSVLLYDTSTSKLQKAYATKNYLSIEHLEWSDDGRHLSFSFSGKRVIIMSVEFSSEHVPIVETEVDILVKTHGANVAISQLLFNQASTQMAIFSPSTVQIVSLSSVSITKSIELHTNVPSKWIAHPYDSCLMIGVMARSVRILDWELIEQKDYQFEHPPPLDRRTAPPFSQGQGTTGGPAKIPTLPITAGFEGANVDRVLITHGRNKHLVVQISLRGPTSRDKVFLSFDISWFSISPFPSMDGPSRKGNTDLTQPLTTAESILRPTHFLLEEVAKDVSTVLGFLPQNRLLFLSRTFAVRTWQIPPSGISSSSGVRSSLPLLSNPNPAHVRTASIPTTQPSKDGRRPLRPDDPYQTPTANDEGSAFWTKGPPLNDNLGGNGFRSQHISPPAFAAGGAQPAKSLPLTKALFYLPGDWISRDFFAPCLLWPKEISLLCPRNGEVAVVRCTALA